MAKRTSLRKISDGIEVVEQEYTSFQDLVEDGTVDNAARSVARGAGKVVKTAAKVALAAVIIGAIIESTKKR